MQIENITTTQELISKNNAEHLQENSTDSSLEKTRASQQIVDAAKNIPKDDDVDKAQISDALAKMSKTIEFFNKRLKFSIDENSKRIVVKVIDSDSNQVVREIPPKEVLKFVANLHKFLGVFVDTKR